MQTKLKYIADIQYGPYEKASDNGELMYLLASHFDEDGRLTMFNDSYLDVNSRNEKFILQKDDVILAAKGQRMFAWPYKEEYGKCIPSSLFYIIRINLKEAIGEYVAYYLNSEKVQYEIKNMATGGSMPSIPKKELMELEIYMPPLSEQKRIVEVANVLDKDIELTQQLLQEKITLKKGIITKMIINQNRKKDIKKVL